MFPVAACRGRVVQSSGPALPTTNLAFGFTADAQWCLDLEGGSAVDIDGEVGAWYDRTNTYYAENVGALENRPILTSSGGLTWLYGNGSTSWLLFPSDLDFGNYDSGMTVYTRSKFQGAAAGGYAILLGAASGSASTTYFGKDDGSDAFFSALPGLSGYGNGTRATATIPENTDVTHCMTYTAGTSVTIHQDGTLVNTTGSVGSTMSSNRLGLFGVNGDQEGVGVQLQYRGLIRHFLVYSAVHNADQRAAVLAFLAT